MLQSYAAWEAGYSPEGVWNGSLPQWLITNALDAETLPEAEFEALVGMSQRLKSGERKVSEAARGEKEREHVHIAF